MILVYVLAAPVAGLVVATMLRVVGVERARAAVLGVLAAIGSAVAVVALFVVFAGECLAENVPEDRLSYPWSPRTHLCGSHGSGLANVLLASALIPAVVAIAGGALARRGRRHENARLGAGAWLCVVATVPAGLAPWLLVAALPAYRKGDTPVYASPLLRAAAGPQPARACYVHGIMYGPRKLNVDAQTPRTCIEFRHTREADRLTGLAGGSPQENVLARTDDALRAVAEHLSREGVKPGDTGVAGLSITRAYRLSGERAGEGAIAIG